MIIHNDDDSYYPSIIWPKLTRPAKKIDSLARQNFFIQLQVQSLTDYSRELRTDMKYLKAQVDQLHKDTRSKTYISTDESYTIIWTPVCDQMPEDEYATYFVRKANGKIGVADYWPRDNEDDEDLSVWIIYGNQNAEYVSVNDKSSNRITDWALVPDPKTEGE
jgi:hypothetical protein